MGMNHSCGSNKQLKMRNSSKEVSALRYSRKTNVVDVARQVEVTMRARYRLDLIRSSGGEIRRQYGHHLMCPFLQNF
jgi:hypothetical protein